MSKKTLLVGLIIGLFIGYVVSLRSANIISFESKIRELEGQVVSLQSQIGEKDEIISSLQFQIKDKDAIVSELELKIADKNITISELQSKIAKFEGEVDRLETENQGLQSRLENASAYLAALQAELENIKMTYEALQASYAELEVSYEDVSKRFTSLLETLNISVLKNWTRTTEFNFTAGPPKTFTYEIPYGILWDVTISFSGDYIWIDISYRRGEVRGYVGGSGHALTEKALHLHGTIRVDYYDDGSKITVTCNVVPTKYPWAGRNAYAVFSKAT